MKQIFLVDLNKDHSRRFPYFSETLLTKIEQNIKTHKKILIYINKRGAFHLCICQDCHFLYECPKCDIPLSVHSSPKMLLCHHCGYQEDIKHICPKCGGNHLKNIGVGTQQIEDIIKTLFPEKIIFRMDGDSTTNISQKKQTLDSMKQADIIIGTKMITTGFDFENIGLIAVILLEQEMQIPSYDTYERMYQNIVQLTGRGGRKGHETDIIFQSYIPHHENISQFIHGNYKNFFLTTLEERKLFGYPPFTQIAAIRYKNSSKEKCIEFIDQIFITLETYNESKDIEIIRVPRIYKRDNQYFGKIILKGQNIRLFLQKIKKEIFKNKDLALIFE